jgi:hypothetical protein
MKLNFNQEPSNDHETLVSHAAEELEKAKAAMREYTSMTDSQWRAFETALEAQRRLDKIQFSSQPKQGTIDDFGDDMNNTVDGVQMFQGSSVDTGDGAQTGEEGDEKTPEQKIQLPTDIGDSNIQIIPNNDSTDSDSNYMRDAA